MSWNIEGKQVLLTGASRGIGRATALALAKQNANLTLLVRNRELGEKVVEEIRAVGGKGKVDLIVADLSSMKDVVRAADEYKSKHDRLDVAPQQRWRAINMDRETTTDGYERTFATNHLGILRVLTDHLLDLAMKKSAPSRIINVASEAHRQGSNAFTDPNYEKNGYSGFGAYGTSKLANILFTRELAKKLEGTGVTANSLHPGVIASGFGRNNKGVFGFIMRNLASPFLGSEESGAKTSVYLATSPEVDGKTGLYCETEKLARKHADQGRARRRRCGDAPLEAQRRNGPKSAEHLRNSGSLKSTTPSSSCRRILRGRWRFEHARSRSRASRLSAHRARSRWSTSGARQFSGLSAKPIIDVLIGVAKLDDADACIPILIAARLGVSRTSTPG